MTEIKHHHHPDEGPHKPSDHDNSIPYWKRAHRDWRLWTAVFFVAAALAIYIVTVDLSLVPRVHVGSATVGKQGIGRIAPDYWFQAGATWR